MLRRGTCVGSWIDVHGAGNGWYLLERVVRKTVGCVARGCCLSNLSSWRWAHLAPAAAWERVASLPVLFLGFVLLRCGALRQLWYSWFDLLARGGVAEIRLRSGALPVKPVMVDRPASSVARAGSMFSGDACASGLGCGKSRNGMPRTRTANRAGVTGGPCCPGGTCQSGGTCMGAMMGTGGTCVSSAEA